MTARKIILAPHLDDEIVGCYSILDQIDLIIWFHKDHRERIVENNPLYLQGSVRNIPGIHGIKPGDTLYLPSKYDYHPLHRRVRAWGMQIPDVKRMFYSVEMNTPWNELEERPNLKREMLKNQYPNEYNTLNKSDKYFLFKSIKPYDDTIYASVKFQREGFHCWPEAPDEVAFLRNLHRHMFHIQVDIQQFGDDRDIEYFIFSLGIQEWYDEQSSQLAMRTSCEQIAQMIKLEVLRRFPDRLSRVSVYEDGENGCILE